MECSLCDADASDLEANFESIGIYAFCDSCWYSVMELGELRCEYCEETITRLELYECVHLNLGNGEFVCEDCSHDRSRSDSDSEDDNAGMQGGPPLGAGPFTLQASAVSLHAVNTRKRKVSFIDTYCALCGDQQLKQGPEEPIFVARHNVAYCGDCVYTLRHGFECEVCEEKTFLPDLEQEPPARLSSGLRACYDCQEGSSEESSEEEGGSPEVAAMPTSLAASTLTLPKVDAAAARARNLRDIQRLRAALPGFCSHHVLYYHVLGAVSRGCTNSLNAEGCCTAGGRARSHEFPDGLETMGLEALDYA
jgi:hypothetical protein